MLKRLPSPGHRFFWISTALLIKVIILGYFLYQSQQLTPGRVIGHVVVKQNDYGFFLGVVDNYFSTGTMTYIEGKPFAGRMPGYGIPYMLLRYVMPQQAALVSLIFLQVLLSAISVYVLARMALMLLRHEKYFHITFFLFAISTYTSLFDIFTLSESFSVSAVIFMLFFLFRYVERERAADLVLAGFFLAWCIFLRPFLGLFIIIIPLSVLLWKWKRNGFAKAFTHAALLCLPFIVFEAAWIIRNYNALGKFVPLETALNESYGKHGPYRASAIAIRQLITGWGGVTGEFYDNSEAWWFHHAQGEQVNNYQFKPHVFNDGFTRDSLVRLKEIFNASGDMARTEHERDSLNTVAETIALKYAESYKQSNKLRYYVLNPFVRVKQLAFSNPNLLMPLPKFSEMNILQKGIKLGYTAMYFIIVAAGLIGALIMLFKRKMDLRWFMLLVIPLIITLTIIFNPLSIIENRYFLTAYPALLLFTVYLYSVIRKQREERI
jgi:hypothetical protein